MISLPILVFNDLTTHAHTLLQALLFSGTRKDKQQLANEMCAFFIGKIANIRAAGHKRLFVVSGQTASTFREQKKFHGV